MAKTISELPAATAVADIDELELTQSGVSRKATRAQLVSGLAPAEHTHDAADIGSGTFADARVSESNVKQHEAALSITEAQIADLSHDAAALRGVSLDAAVGTPSDGDLLVYRGGGDDWVLEPKPAGGSNPALNDVVDVTIGSPADDEVLAFDQASGEWINQTAVEAGLAEATHTHDAADIGSGTFADARISESNVKQHQAALSITEAQISDLSHDAAALRGVSLDPAVGTPADGDLLVYRSAGDDWVLEPKPAGGSNPTLNDVADVTIGSPADDEILAFDQASGEWINQTAAEAGLAEAGHTHGLADITDSGALAAKDSVATTDLADDAVSLAKMAHGTPDVLLGLDGGGAPAEITAGQGVAIAGAQIAADVASVFGRTGAVSAQAGDYDGLPLDLQDASLTRPQIKDYSEASTAPAIASGTLTLDLEAGNVFDVVLTEDVTSISVVNAPASGSLGTVTVRFRQDATGGRTVDLSGFDFGSAPTPAMPGTATTGRLWITALTLDGGAVWEAVAGFEKG